MKDIGAKPNLEKGVYRHYKGGMYDILELACHTETLEWYVVYQSHERKKLGIASVWIRPYDMFVETVELNGEHVPRFEKVPDEIEEITPVGTYDRAGRATR